MMFTIFLGCGHCKKAKPEFTKAAEFFKNDPKIEFAAIDCTTYQSLCSANEVSGYPTIKYFNYLNKNVKVYNSGRTAQDFINFMNEIDLGTNQFVQELTDMNFDNEIQSKSIVFVLFYTPCKYFIII